MRNPYDGGGVRYPYDRREVRCPCDVKYNNSFVKFDKGKDAENLKKKSLKFIRIKISTLSNLGIGTDNKHYDTTKCTHIPRLK